MVAVMMILYTPTSDGSVALAVIVLVAAVNEMKEGYAMGREFCSKVRVYETEYKQSKSLHVAAANTIDRGASLIA